MGSLLCFSWSYVPYYLFYRVNSATYFLLPLVAAIATLCIDAYFLCFPILALKVPTPKASTGNTELQDTIVPFPQWLGDTAGEVKAKIL